MVFGKQRSSRSKTEKATANVDTASSITTNFSPPPVPKAEEIDAVEEQVVNDETEEYQNEAVVVHNDEAGKKPAATATNNKAALVLDLIPYMTNIIADHIDDEQEKIIRFRPNRETRYLTMIVSCFDL